MLILSNKNNNHKFFEKIILTFILLYAPLILKIIIENNMDYEFVLILSSLLVFLWEYITSFLNFLRFNIDNAGETIARYKEISNKKIDLSFKVATLTSELVTHNNNKNCSDTEIGINSIYFLFKFCFYTILFFYFKNMGSKLDKKSKLSWGIFFIPIYFAQIPIIIYCILYFKTLNNKKCSKITKAFSLLSIFSGFFINSIIIPLIAEGYEINPIAIPILFCYSSVNIFIHYKYVS